MLLDEESKSIIVTLAIVIFIAENLLATIGVAQYCQQKSRDFLIVTTPVRCIQVFLLLLFFTSYLNLNLFIIYSVTTYFLVFALTLRFDASWRSIVKCYILIKRYSFKIQIIAFVTGFFLQLPLLILSSSYQPLLVSAYLLYSLRVLNMAMQPIQILQSLFVRKFFLSNNADELSKMIRKVIFVNVVLFLILSSTLALYYQFKNQELLLFSLIAMGLAIYVYGKNTFSLALTDIKNLRFRVSATVVFSATCLLLGGCLIWNEYISLFFICYVVFITVFNYIWSPKCLLN
jgi:hypothetical protein